MRFSIRAVLALTFLAALATLAWSTVQRAKRSEAHAEALRNEVKSLKLSLRTDDPARYQARLHEIHRYKSLDALREKALRQFDHLVKKYGSMEERQPDVLSLRTLPSLPTDNGSAPHIFRLLVPAQRPVWLKVGVHTEQSSANSSSEADKLELLHDSPYTQNGPFESQLPPGIHTISVARENAENGAQPLSITLDDQELLRTALIADGINGGGTTSIAADVQIDFPPDQPLPWLITLTTNLDVASETAAKMPAISVWLSDQSSDFQEFPGDDP